MILKKTLMCSFLLAPTSLLANAIEPQEANSLDTAVDRQHELVKNARAVIVRVPLLDNGQDDTDLAETRLQTSGPNASSAEDIAAAFDEAQDLGDENPSALRSDEDPTRDSSTDSRRGWGWGRGRGGHGGYGGYGRGGYGGYGHGGYGGYGRGGYGGYGGYGRGGYGGYGGYGRGGYGGYGGYGRGGYGGYGHAGYGGYGRGGYGGYGHGGYGGYGRGVYGRGGYGHGGYGGYGRGGYGGYGHSYPRYGYGRGAVRFMTPIVSTIGGAIGSGEAYRYYYYPRGS